MKPIRFKPCGYVQNSNDKKYRLKWRTWPDPPIPTISRLLSRNCTEYLPACTWNNIWDRIRIRKTKYKTENTLTYTYFTNLSSVHSVGITHYYTMHKADSSPFSLLSVLSADGKIFPKLFPYFKTYPTGTDRPHIHQSQTTSSNKLYKYPLPTWWIPSSCKADTLKIIILQKLWQYIIKTRKQPAQ